VRDNLHSVDVCRAIVAFAERPSAGAVYNLGGGRANSVSMLEAIGRFEELFNRKLAWEYVEEPRRGDHICYISNLDRLRADYPSWDVSVSLDAIVDDFAKMGAEVA
jgi:CDP-paratose 2-epimerase